MTDYTELKRLAERASLATPWYYLGDLLTETIDDSGDAAYIAAASPDVVLGLIKSLEHAQMAAEAEAKEVDERNAVIDRLRTQNRALVEALKRIVFTVPALDGAGGLFFEHHGFDGESLGVQQIDPMWVIEEMAGVAQSALAQAEGWV